MAKKQIGYDYDNVASEQVFTKGAVVITGRPEEDNDEILETLGENLKPSKIYNYPHDDLEDANGRNIKIGIWKAKTIKVLGIEKFFEDEEDQIQIINELAPKTEVVKVIDGVPQEKLNFIIFHHSNTPILSIAEKLEKEGNRVILGVIEESKKTLLPDEEDKPEEPKEKAKRLSLYTGIIDKFPADEVLKVMKRIKDKENWIVLTDSNSNYQYATKALEMGFTKGLFPTEWDRSMECDRKKAKDFVKENYPDIKVAEVKEFKTTEEGVTFLNENEDLWVLKSKGDAGTTVCPTTEDPEMARTEIIAALEEMKKDYEENGFLLEPRILEPIELTPQQIWIDGTPIFTDLDIEIKTIAAGSAIQTGCAMMLNVKTEAEDRINKIAFPQVIHDMAKERTGIFVWDLSILIDKKGDMWFGEFCSMRMGYDDWMVELAMSGDDEGSKIATPFFSSLFYKKNPLRKRYGVGVRLLNIGNGGHPVEGGTVEVKDEATPDVYLFEVQKGKDGKLVSTDYCFDFGVVTGADDELNEAIEKAYKYVDMVMFEGKFYRSKEDFESYDYSASIKRRLDYAINYNFISSDTEDLNKAIGSRLY